jgi:hypothetical protein
MTGLLAALVVVAGGIAALLLIGLGIWFQISRLGRWPRQTRHAACRSERGRSSSSSSRRSAASCTCSSAVPAGQVS